MIATFIDSGQILEDFAERMYVCCPACRQCACVMGIPADENEDHVRFLEHYVTAKQRIKFHEEGWVRNGTLASRLPIWIKRAKNRDEIIKGMMRLQKLQEKSFS